MVRNHHPSPISRPEPTVRDLFYAHFAKTTFSAACEACPTEGRSRGPFVWSGPRTVIEVPRRQSTGSNFPRDVVAEIEEVVEGVFEDETEDGVESGLAIEPATTSARYFRSDSACSILRFLFFIFMVVPTFPQIARLEIPRGPAKKNKSKQRARRPPTRGRKISFALPTFPQGARMLPFASKADAIP